jgi:hypothetical protein
MESVLSLQLFEATLEEVRANCVSGVSCDSGQSG